MLNRAEKIITLASILGNITLSGNKQTHKQKSGQCFAEAGGPFQQRAQETGHAVD